MNEKIYCWGEKKGIIIYKFFALAMFIMGMMYSVLIPVAQTPDEGAHLMMIGEEFGLSDYTAETIGAYYQEAEIGKIMMSPESKLNIKPYIQSFSYRFSSQNEKRIPKLSLNIVRHLPAGIGFYIGILLHLPVYFCLEMAELFSVLFYIIMGVMALKLMPVKKELLCAIMLLPMTIQQCSSINYDSVLLPCSFLFLALVFYYKYIKEIVGWKEFIGLFLLLGVITIIKLPYVILAALILLIPAEKIRLSVFNLDIVLLIKKYKWIFIMGIGILGSIVIYIYPEVVFVKTIKCGIVKFPRYCELLLKTLFEYVPWYCISMVGILGWLDTPLSNIFYVFSGIVLIILSLVERKCIRKKEKGVFVFVIGGITVLVLTAMITYSFSIAGFNMDADLAAYKGYLEKIDYIEGVQGRYFLPYIFLFFLLFDGIKVIKKEKVVLLQILYYATVFVYTCAALILRYWVA